MLRWALHTKIHFIAKQIIHSYTLSNALDHPVTVRERNLLHPSSSPQHPTFLVVCTNGESLTRCRTMYWTPVEVTAKEPKGRQEAWPLSGTPLVFVSRSCLKVENPLCAKTGPLILTPEIGGSIICRYRATRGTLVFRSRVIAAILSQRGRNRFAKRNEYRQTGRCCCCCCCCCCCKISPRPYDAICSCFLSPSIGPTVLDRSFR